MRSRSPMRRRASDVEEQRVTKTRVVRPDSDLSGRAAEVVGGRSRSAAQQTVHNDVRPARREPLSAIPVRPAAAPGDRIRRLSVDHTQWNLVNSITASQEGGGGVLFMTDPGGPPVIVKPGVRATEELLAAQVHSRVEAATAAGGAPGRWAVSSLRVRIAGANDVVEIGQAFQRVLARAPNDGGAVTRATTLLDHLSTPGTATMVQEAATQPQGAGGTYGGQVTAQTAAAGGHMTTSGRGRSKVRSASPLKPLVKEMGFATALGRMAATDILTGNDDRLAGLANTSNFMINRNTKTVFPIDNVYEVSTKAMFVAVAGAQAQPDFQTWAQSPMTLLLQAQDFDRIAASIIRIGPQFDPDAVDIGATMGDELAGRTGGQQQAVEAKLVRHLVPLRQAFAAGVAQAYHAMAAPAMRHLPANFPAEAARMYRARILFIRGDTAAAAWQNAAQPPPAQVVIGRHAGRRVGAQIQAPPPPN